MIELIVSKCNCFYVDTGLISNMLFLFLRNNLWFLRNCSSAAGKRIYYTA